MLPAISASRPVPTLNRAVSSSVLSPKECALPTQPMFKGHANFVTFTMGAPRWANFGGYLNDLKIFYPEVTVAFNERKGAVRASYAVRLSSDSALAIYKATLQIKSDMERYTGEPVTALDEAIEKFRRALFP